MDSVHEQMLCEEILTFHHVSCDDSTLAKRWHYHKRFEFHYFRSFSGVASVGDYVGELASESLFVLAPGVPHSWTGDGEKCQSD